MHQVRLTEDDLPGFWKDADSASLNGQMWTMRYVRARLLGSVVAALGGLLSLHAGRLDVAAALVMVGFLVALAAEIASWIHKPERTWYEGRALAESAKTLSWRFAVCADPFPASMPMDSATDLLRTRMDEVSEGVAAHVVFSSQSFTCTDKMMEVRSAPYLERRTAYVAGRTQEQHTWYANKAKLNRRHATGWRVILVLAELLALVLAALRVFGGWDADLAGLMGALIAAGGAWVAVKQFVPLASAYSVAAKELAIQTEKLKGTAEQDWALVAADAEEAISREHTTWLASRTGRSSI